MWGDDYSVSKALRVCIMSMRRGEMCKLVCKLGVGPKDRIKYGRDWQSIKDHPIQIDAVTYYIILKDFTEVSSYHTHYTIIF